MNDIYVVGDIHGKMRELVFKITHSLNLRDSLFVVLGDIGFGFERRGYYDSLYRKISNRLESHNNKILCLRGNHDDPSYFSGETSLNYPRLSVISDYSLLDLNGRSALVIGGATSLDGEWRRSRNVGYSSVGSPKRFWWDDEGIDMVDLDTLNRVDLVLSHEAPSCFDLETIRFPETTAEEYNRAIKEREYLSEVCKKVSPSRWYFGHHHKHICGDYGPTKYFGLSELEIIKI